MPVPKKCAARFRISGFLTVGSLKKYFEPEDTKFNSADIVTKQIRKFYQNFIESIRTEELKPMLPRPYSTEIKPAAKAGKMAKLVSKTFLFAILLLILPPGSLLLRQNTSFLLGEGARPLRIKSLSAPLFPHRGKLLAATPAPKKQKDLKAGGKCPWTSPYELSHFTPSRLASQVVSHMNLADILNIIGLIHVRRGYENSTIAVPQLCIPAFTLQDGPNGLSAGDGGVTQLPASLALGATFNPQDAYKYGQIVGAEAKKQQIDAVQGPNLNLVRLPEWGRAYETYGEDPYLAAALGIADVKGIQSKGIMAVAKHFTAYTEETDRINLNQKVSDRALIEIYIKPFKAVVQQANVAAIMCAYGQINGVNACSDAYTFRLLRQFGFQGIIRSDLAAVKQPTQAFNAGLDQLKPLFAPQIIIGLLLGRLHIKTLAKAAKTVLTDMFSYHLIPGPDPHNFGTDTITAQATHFSYRLAANSAVLLKNSGSLLPVDIKKIKRLSPKKTGRTKGAAPPAVAVIGADAAGQAMTAGYGGARVTSPFLVTPLRALGSYYGKYRMRIAYSSGGPDYAMLPLIKSQYLGGKSLPVKYWPKRVGKNESVFPDGYLRYSKVPPAALTANSPGVPGPHNDWNFWTAELRPPKTGLYDFSVSSVGDAWIYINKTNVFAAKGLGAPSTNMFSYYLSAKKTYRISMRWFATRTRPAPRIGFEDVTPAIRAAASLARHTKVAVVFVNCYSSEGIDRPNLNLPGADNQLISAVAKANPKTIVVLNTGGAVLMPWLKNVRSVIEAWYPGEEDGNAIRAVLSGQIDPSGHLPVTFPASVKQVFGGNPKAWPGVNGKTYFSLNNNSGLEIGYRYYQAHRLKPLFPFGYGLSYTDFSMSGLSVTQDPPLSINTGHIPLSYGNNPPLYTADLNIKNTGKLYGCTVAQIYLGFPKSAHEPPKQLAGFDRVCLASKQMSKVAISVPLSNFEIYKSGYMSVPNGNFVIYAGFSSAATNLEASVSP